MEWPLSACLTFSVRAASELRTSAGDVAPCSRCGHSSATSEAAAVSARQTALEASAAFASLSMTAEATGVPRVDLDVRDGDTRIR
jgi:hypothetical protein